jgi:murein DD-endopeptidase MepM/ murein hydrolase activator NlpD
MNLINMNKNILTIILIVISHINAISQQNIIHYLQANPETLQTSLVIDSAQSKKISKDSINGQLNYLQKLATVKASLHDYMASVPSIFPLKHLPYGKLINSFYQKRRHPISHQIKMHNGIDLSALKGTPVYATADGIVKEVFLNTSAIGYAIKIQHAHDFSSLYGHLLRLPQLHKGDIVKRGQLIAFVGNSGNSTGAHLHYGLYYKSKAIDPIAYFLLAQR